MRSSCIIPKNQHIILEQKYFSHTLPPYTYKVNQDKKKDAT